jgi:hypothetical protein
VFVAGLVSGAASELTTLSLFRVLNDFGAGDTVALLWALHRCLERLREQPDRRYVINLSLTLAVPPREVFLHTWLAWQARLGRLVPALLLPRSSSVDAVLEPLVSPLGDVLARLSALGCVIAAAAGNDSLALAAPLDPRYPACFDTVLSVASVESQGLRSAFSNKGNASGQRSGVATWGGELDPLPADAPPDAVTSPDAPAGVYISERFPSGGANATGWARWAGTSVATALLSGLAAQLLASDPVLASVPRHLLGERLVERLVELGSDPLDPSVCCRTIQAKQS